MTHHNNHNEKEQQKRCSCGHHHDEQSPCCDDHALPHSEQEPQQHALSAIEQPMSNKTWKLGALLLIIFVLAVQLATISANFGGRSLSGETQKTAPPASGDASQIALQNAVLPQEGVILPIVWGNIGKQMVETGVIDRDRFEQIAKQGAALLTDEQRELLYGDSAKNIVMRRDNAGFLLNLLWGFGLANKSSVLSNGPMSQNNYASQVASTGGWTVAVGGPMKHYNTHEFVKLTAEQEALVEKITQGIFRPCCGNSTYFPDCNHGMAMLGLVELLVANGVSEDEIYRIALSVNAYWFPGQYLAIATYLQQQGASWESANAKEILGGAYSSAQGMQRIQQLVSAPSSGGGSSCSLGASSASPLVNSSSGCGL